jgi:hypothetical protein
LTGESIHWSELDSIIVASQHVPWSLSRLSRLHYSIRTQRHTGLLEQASECRPIFAPAHQTIPDPALLMCALAGSRSCLSASKFLIYSSMNSTH